jgi:hypothetical protein
MFTENSMLVKIWFSAVLAGTYTYDQVPNVSNLREEVKKKLDQIGYNTETTVQPT